jgi:hypothetical protein
VKAVGLLARGRQGPTMESVLLVLLVVSLFVLLKVLAEADIASTVEFPVGGEESGGVRWWAALALGLLAVVWVAAWVVR